MRIEDSRFHEEGRHLEIGLLTSDEKLRPNLDAFMKDHQKAFPGELQRSGSNHRNDRRIPPRRLALLGTPRSQRLLGPWRVAVRIAPDRPGITSAGPVAKRLKYRPKTPHWRYGQDGTDTPREQHGAPAGPRPGEFPRAVAGPGLTEGRFRR